MNCEREDIGEVMTNFDHSIDRDVAAQLIGNHVEARHSGWNFNGRVWYENDEYHEEVWVHGVPRETIKAGTVRLEAVAGTGGV